MFKFKKNNKSNTIKTKNDIIVETIERATDTLSFNVELLNCDASLQVRLFSKAKLLRYIELVLADDCDVIVVHPSTKGGVKIWNEKMEEAGRPEMKITLEEAIKESDASAAAYKEQKRKHKQHLKDIRENVKAANKRAKEEAEAEKTEAKEKKTKTEKKESKAEKKAEKKAAKAEKKEAKKTNKESKVKTAKKLIKMPKIKFNTPFKKKGKTDLKDSDIEFEENVCKAEAANDTSEQEDATWSADEERIVRSEEEPKETPISNPPSSVPEMEDGVILDNGEPKIIYDAAASEHPTEDEPEEEVKEEEIEEDFDANTGFVKPEFATDKEVAISFDNDKLAMATYDVNGNLIIDEIAQIYDEFLKVYPCIDILWKIAKSASLKIKFSNYVKDGYVAGGLLIGDIVDIENKFVRRIFVDINKIYGNGINVILSTGKDDILDEFFVNISNTDILTKLITRDVSNDEITIERSSYPEYLKDVVSHIDMASLMGRKLSRSQYWKLVDLVNTLLFNMEWVDFDPKNCRFRFDQFKSIDNFNIIADEWVTYIPDTKQNLYSEGDKRYWISYNGRKKQNDRIESGVLDIAGTNPYNTVA